MHEPHLLLLDADDVSAQLLSLELEHAGYRVTRAVSAGEALALAGRMPFDLVLVESRVVEVEALAMQTLLQSAGRSLCMLIGPSAGAAGEAPGMDPAGDNIVRTPLYLPVLQAGANAARRRSSGAYSLPPPLVVGDLTLSATGRAVTVAGRAVHLAPREFSLLHALATRAGCIVPADELLSRVWGSEFVGEPQVLYVHVRWLRQKLEEDPAHPQRILTRRGAGYLLEPCPPAEAGVVSTASGAGAPHARK